MTQELLEKKLTPMMEQWSRCKETAKDALLLFRMGDFYEAFYEDAEIVARELDLTLTKRQEIPMSGVPCHASEAYIDRLVAKGYRIAIAEQTEDPKAVKGLVKREVTRFVTPGTTFSSSFLSDKSNNYIACLAQVGSVSGMSVLDITTGEFKAMECENDKELANEIFRLRPSEFLVTAKFKDKQASLFKEMEIAFSPLVTACDEWSFEHRTASTFLAKHFQVHHLDGFGLKGMIAAINASGALLYYIHEILSFSISHIKTLKPYFIGDSLSLDRSTARHLEIMDSAQGEKKQTLFWIMDRTATPMGGRCLKRWMQQPLLSVKEISKRQEAVEALISHPQQLAKLHQILQEVRDVERLIMKLNSGYVVPRDLLMLRQSLEVLPSIKQIIQAIPSEKIFELSLSCCDFHSLVTLLKRSFQDELPLRINEGNLFKEGYRSDLDELRSIMRNGKEWMARYQHRIREETGIKNLKVSYNKIFGYYIEVSKGQSKWVPETFQKRQTLVNSERYCSSELKEYELKVLSAEEKMCALEAELFHQLKDEILAYSDSISHCAHALGELDVFHSFALIAKERNYVRPIVDESTHLEIIEGRHPVIETFLPKDTFISNNTILDGKSKSLMLITGPNMAGKSTYIRQTALIVIMAQMGSFIPAKKANIGVIDKIFTRIGASDDLSRGQSTFMVEMSETANILNNATHRSLVILDEIGRGTSTYDGVAIAWSVAEYLLASDEGKPKTLFATHYWELTQLENRFSSAVNYHAAVQEWNDEIVFLHKIITGSADRSYGIHVARLAGLPIRVIARAQEILNRLEKKSPQKEKFQEKKEQAKIKEQQLSFFDAI